MQEQHRNDVWRIYAIYGIHGICCIIMLKVSLGNRKNRDVYRHDNKYPQAIEMILIYISPI